MRKLKVLLTVTFLAALLAGCNMVPWEDIVSLNVTPTLIKKMPKVYPGGNVDCEGTGISGLLRTTGRINYDPSTGTFDQAWPSGLLVKVYDNKSVSFQIDGSINLGDGKCYKVGAVIVKGSDASNVYDYTDIGGATMDAGLVAPNNSSGGPAGLSNLTFCFMECKEKEPVYISVKAYYLDKTTGKTWAATSLGLTFPTCPAQGHNRFPDTPTFSIVNYWFRDVIGSVNVTEGAGALTVKLTLNSDYEFYKTYLYVGSLAGLESTISDGCPDYDGNTLWKFDDTDGNEVTFVIPY